MKNEITILIPNTIRIADKGENSTMYYVMPAYSLALSKNSVDAYTEHARKLLNELSNEYNAIGMQGLIAALLIETMGNGNNGIHN